MNKTIWGLDVAGESSPNGLAKLEVNKEVINIEVYDTNLFEDTDVLIHFFKSILEKEENILVIDTPLDLQYLKKFTKEKFLKITKKWQINYRPVDYAFNALRPIGSDIGTVLSRVHYALAKAAEDSDLDWQDLLNKRIFETYPKASFSLLIGLKKGESPTYKGKTFIMKEDGFTSTGEFKLKPIQIYKSLNKDFKWFRVNLYNREGLFYNTNLDHEEFRIIKRKLKNDQQSLEKLEKIINEAEESFLNVMNSFRIKSNSGLELTDDHIDAIACGLSYIDSYRIEPDHLKEVVLSRIECTEEDLNGLIKDKLNNDEANVSNLLPDGFILFNKIPSGFELSLTKSSNRTPWE